MSEIKEIIDEIVQAALAVPLKEQGFKRSGRNWRRPKADSIQVINVQASRHNLGTNGEFTVNLGVYFPRVPVELAATITDKPTEPDCHVRQRIGGILGRGDFWWKIRSRANLAEIIREVQQFVLADGLEWLDGFKTYADAADSPDLAGSIWDRMMIMHLAGQDDRVLRSMEEDLLQSDIRRWAWKDAATRYGFLPQYEELLELTRDRFESTKRR